LSVRVPVAIERQDAQAVFDLAASPQIRVPRSGNFFVHGMGEDLADGLGPGERLATVVPAVGEQADRGCELVMGHLRFHRR
jgi:hypothetical protein